MSAEGKSSFFDGTLLSLVGDTGEQIELEHLDTIEYEGSFYFALSPVHQTPGEYVDADGDLVFMKVVQDGGEDLLRSLSDTDPEYEVISALFEERLAEEYELIWEDD